MKSFTKQEAKYCQPENDSTVFDVSVSWFALSVIDLLKVILQSTLTLVNCFRVKRLADVCFPPLTNFRGNASIFLATTTPALQ
jgi:hypothetical protein